MEKQINQKKETINQDIMNHILGPSGARRLDSLDGLLHHQREVAEAILLDIDQIARTEAKHIFEASEKDAKGNLSSQADPVHYTDEVFFRHPNNVHVITGDRGSGKTTLLLTLHYFAHFLGGGHYVPIFSKPGTQGEGFSRPDVAKLSNGAHGDELDTAFNVEIEQKSVKKSTSNKEYKTINRFTSLVLPIIYPNDFFDNEDAMEHVFAAIELRLARQIDQKPLKDVNANVDINDFKKLRTELRSDIGAGWTFSHDIGLETLSRDSLDYKDFVNRRSEQMYLRLRAIGKWRIFINKLLDTFGAQVLLVSIDDSDLSARTGSDILDAIRLYLSHPRIITILCTNYSSLKEHLTLHRLSKISTTLRDLSAIEKSKTYADDHCKREKKETLEYLNKVLPPQRRYRLGYNREDLVKPIYTSLIQKLKNKDRPDSQHLLTWWMLFIHYPLFALSNVRDYLALVHGFTSQRVGPLVLLSQRPALQSLVQVVGENNFDLDSSKTFLNLISFNIILNRYQLRSHLGDDLDEDVGNWICLAIDVLVAEKQSKEVCIQFLKQTWVAITNIEMPDTVKRIVDTHRNNQLRDGILELIDNPTMPSNLLRVSQLQIAQNAMLTPAPSGGFIWDPIEGGLDQELHLKSNIIVNYLTGKDAAWTGRELGYEDKVVKLKGDIETARYAYLKSAYGFYLKFQLSKKQRKYSETDIFPMIESCKSDIAGLVKFVKNWYKRRHEHSLLLAYTRQEIQVAFALGDTSLSSSHVVSQQWDSILEHWALFMKGEVNNKSVSESRWLALMQARDFGLAACALERPLHRWIKYSRLSATADLFHKIQLALTDCLVAWQSMLDTLPNDWVEWLLYDLNAYKKEFAQESLHHAMRGLQDWQNELLTLKNNGVPTISGANGFKDLSLEKKISFLSDERVGAYGV
jgi:hypothetical protein